MHTRSAVALLLALGLWAGVALPVLGASAGQALTGAELTELFGPYTHGAVLDGDIRPGTSRDVRFLPGSIVLGSNLQAYIQWLDRVSGTAGQDSGKWRIVGDTLCVTWELRNLGAETCFRQYRLGENAYESRLAKDDSLNWTYRLRP